MSDPVLVIRVSRSYRPPFWRRPRHTQRLLSSRQRRALSYVVAVGVTGGTAFALNALWRHTPLAENLLLSGSIAAGALLGQIMRHIFEVRQRAASNATG